MSFEKQDLLTFQNQLNGNFIVSPTNQYSSLNDYLVAQALKLQALEQRVQVTLPLDLTFLETTKATVNNVQALRTETLGLVESLAPVVNPTFQGVVTGVTAEAVGLGNVDNTSDMDLPISYATQAALDTKISITTFETELATKASVASLNSLNSIVLTKVSQSELQDSLDEKVDIAEYNDLVTVVNLKANTSDVTTALALKASTTDVSSALDLKADITYVDAELELKANITDVDLKANLTYVNDQLDLKLNTLDAQNLLLLEADLEYVNEQLALKANTTDVSSALDLKADITYVDTQVAFKANSSDVATSLALKANTSYVDTQLALKANSSAVNTALAEKVSYTDFTTEVVDIDNAIAAKQDILSSTNRLTSSNVSTYINETNGVLSTVLQSLTDINTSQSTSISTLEGDLVTERNRIDGHHTRLGVVETAIDDLIQADISHSNRMDGMDDLIDTKQTTLSITNKLPASLVSTTTSTVDVVLNDLVTAVQTLDTEKQDVINSTTNKLPYDHINFTGSYWSSLDFPTSIQTKFTSLDNAISTLEGLQEGDVTSFQTINTALTTLDTEKQDVISSSNKLDGAYVKYNNSLTIIEKIDTLSGGGGGIASISYDGVNLETTISDRTIIGTDLEFPDASIQTTAFTSSKNTDLGNVKTKVTDISYTTGVTTIANELSCNNITGTTISDIQSSLSGKQNTLNNTTNLLPYTYVDFTGSNIPYADYGSSITTKFSALDTTLSNQSTTNIGFANDISGLTTSKQDVLSADNKLNSAFLACSGSGVMSNTKMEYLSSISSDIQTQISSKQDTITDGSLTIARTSGLQTELDAKANKAGETYTGTHDFSGATVTGVGATIADGALSIAKTANLQTTLDSKLSNMSFIMAIQPMYNVSNSYSSTFSGGAANLFLQTAWTIGSGNQTSSWSFVVQIDNSKLVNGCKYLCIFNTLTDSNFTTGTSTNATLSVDTGVGSPTTYTPRLRQDQAFRTGVTILSNFVQANLQGSTHTPTIIHFTADTTNGTYLKIFCDTKVGSYFKVNFGTFLLYKLN
jgi:hypothetical protein